MRVKGGTVTRARRKRIMKLAKGYRGSKHCLFKTAQNKFHNYHSYTLYDRTTFTIHKEKSPKHFMGETINKGYK